MEKIVYTVEDKPVDDPSGSKESIEEKLLKCCKENKMSLLSMGYSIPIVNHLILNDVYMYNLKFIIENFDEVKALISPGRLNEIVMLIINGNHNYMDFFDTENFKILMKLCLKLDIKYRIPTTGTLEYDSDEFFNYISSSHYLYNHEKRNLFVEKYTKIIKELKDEKPVSTFNKTSDGKKRRSKKRSKRKSNKRKI